MAELPHQTDQRICRFPGCTQPAVPSEAGTGRPPEYCDNPAHNKAAAWRERQRLAKTALGQPGEVEGRPVDTARQRASEIAAQLAQVAEHFLQQLPRAIEEIRTAGDLDAAEAQIESVQSEADERVASATARAVKAEQAQRRAEAERAEADAAAVEATEQTAVLQAELEQTRAELAESAQARDQLAAELAETRAAAADEHEQAQAELAQLREALTTVQARLSEVERERDTATKNAAAAAAARAEAEERARGATERADTEAARAERAEAATNAVRGQLDAVRGQVEQLRDQVAELRGSVAAVTAERDAARDDIERERTHGDQRVSDLRTSYEQQLERVRGELDQLRAEVREQRSRADRAEAQQTAQQSGSESGSSAAPGRGRRKSGESRDRGA